MPRNSLPAVKSVSRLGAQWSRSWVKAETLVSVGTATVQTQTQAQEMEATVINPTPVIRVVLPPLDPVVEFTGW